MSKRMVAKRRAQLAYLRTQSAPIHILAQRWYVRSCVFCLFFFRPHSIYYMLPQCHSCIIIFNSLSLYPSFSITFPSQSVKLVTSFFFINSHPLLCHPCYHLLYLIHQHHFHHYPVSHLFFFSPASFPSLSFHHHSFYIIVSVIFTSIFFIVIL